MFHTYTMLFSGFQEWARLANQLYLAHHLDLGGRKNNYRPLEDQITPEPQDDYLLYIDDQKGVCGSALLTPFMDDCEIKGQFLPKGTWILSNVLFHTETRRLSQEQMTSVYRLMTHFHEGLFKQLWHKAQPSSHQLALSSQNDPAIHQDLHVFGGFTIEGETSLDNENEEDPNTFHLAFLPLTPASYQTYRRIQNKNRQRLWVEADRLFPNEIFTLSTVTS